MKYEVKGAFINPPSNVYEPSEDTFLLLEAIREEDVVNKVVLEIGIGNGLISYNLSRLAKVVYGCDINKHALKHVFHVLNINVVLGRSMQPFKDVFDVVVFNPPYLPADSHTTSLDSALVEHPCYKSLIEVVNSIKRNGTVFYFIVSSLCPYDSLLKHLESCGFEYEALKRKRFFFEELVVVRSVKI